MSGRDRDGGGSDLLTALRQATEVRARLLEATDEGIYGIDGQGRVTFMNRAATAMLGWTEAGAVGRRFHDLSHHTRADGSHYPADECPIYATLHGGKALTRDDELFWRADGTSLPVRYRANPVHVDGAPVGAVVVFSDNTARLLADDERRRRHEELEARVAERTSEIARSEARWRSLLDAAPGVVLTVDRDGRLTHLSPAEGRFDPEELIGTTIFDYIPERFHAIQRAALDLAFERGETAVWEVPVDHPDGSTAWYEGHVARVGEQEAVVFTVDVTDRRRQVERRETQLSVARVLAESRDLEEAAPRLLRAMTEGSFWDYGEYWAMDPDGDGFRVLAHRGLGTTAPAVAADALHEIAWVGRPHDDRFVRAAAAARLGRPGSVGIPILVRERAVGALVLCARRVGNVADEVPMLEIIGSMIAQSIERWQTGERLLEARDEAETANRAKSQMLRGMSHELRTPLNAILGFGQLLELADLGDEDRDSVAQVMKAGRRLLKLVDGVLEVARVDTARSGLVLEPVALDQAVNEAVADARTVAREREVSFDAAAFEHPVTALVDRTRLEGILRVIITNAVVHNRPGGSATVTVRAEDGVAVIEVCDTGPGIPADRLETILTPFGSGFVAHGKPALSLVLASRHAEAMGGRLTLHSTVGLGTRARLEVPLGTSSPDGLRNVLVVAPREPEAMDVVSALRGRPGLRMVVAIGDEDAERLAELHRPTLTLTATDGTVALRSTPLDEVVLPAYDRATIRSEFDRLLADSA